jgi:mono/diheme cytochrome c family protein
LIPLNVSERDFSKVAAMPTFPRSIIAGTFAAIILAPTAPSTAGPGAIDQGRALAERLCASCHMGPGQGEKLRPNEIPGFQAVARRPDQSVEGIVEWLRSVPPMMPDHHLSQDEMAALAEFIMSLRTAPP